MDNLTLEYIEEMEKSVEHWFNITGMSPINYTPQLRMERDRAVQQAVLYYLKLGKAGRDLLKKKIEAKEQELTYYVYGKSETGGKKR